MAISLSSLYKGAKEKISSAKKAYDTKAADLGASAYDATIAATKTLSNIKEGVLAKAKTEKENIVGGFQDAYGGKDISQVTNEAMDRLGRAGKQTGEYVWGAIDTQLGIGSNFKGALWATLGGFASVPKAITSGLETVINSTAEAQWLASTWEYLGAGARLAKGTAGWALQVAGNVSALPILINAALESSGLADSANEGIDTLKQGLSTGMQKMGIEPNVADDLGSFAIDGINYYLMRRGGKASENIGGKVKVQGLKDIKVQNDILWQVRAKAAARPNATPESINAAVVKAQPFISQASAKPVTLWEVALNNIKSVGFDVAANSAIPVLGLATQAIERGDYKDLSEALGSNVFASTLAGIVPWVTISKRKAKSPTLDKSIPSEPTITPTLDAVTPVAKSESIDMLNAPKKTKKSTLTEIAKESTDKVFADKLAAGEKETPTVTNKDEAPISPQDKIYAIMDANTIPVDKAFVSKSFNKANAGKLDKGIFATIGWLTEKGMAKIGDEYINLRNMIRTSKSMAPRVGDIILEANGIDKRNQSFPREITITRDDLIGRLTPNEGTEITGQNVGLVEKVLKDLIPSGTKNFVAGTKDQLKALENRANAEIVYTLNKDNPEYLNQRFSPEEIVMLSERNAQNTEVPKQFSNILVNEGYFKNQEIADAYTRFVVSQYGRDKFSAPVKVWGIEFHSMEEALSSMAYRRKHGDEQQQKIADEMEANFASILQSKNAGLDLYRVHSPTIQLLSYAQAFGKLMQDKVLADNFRAFSKPGEKWISLSKEDMQILQEKKEFFNSLFPENSKSSPIIEDIMGITPRQGPVTRIVSWLASGWAKLLTMVGKPIQQLQAIITAPPKAAALSAMYGKNFDLKDAYSPETSQLLGSIGVTSQFDPFTKWGRILTAEWIPVPVKKAFQKLWFVTGEASKIGAGWLWEDPSVRLYGLSDMYHTLSEAGWKFDNPKPNSLDIAKAWNEFGQIPANRDAYQIAINRIMENASRIGESNISTKPINTTSRRSNWTALAWFATGQMNKVLTDSARVLGKIEASWDQRKAAAANLAITLAQWATPAAILTGYYMSDDEETGEKWLEFTDALRHAIKDTNKIAFNPLTFIPQRAANFAGSPALYSLDLMKRGLQYTTAGSPEERTVRLQELVDHLTKTFGPAYAANYAAYKTTWKTLSEMYADKTGWFSTVDMTGTKKAKGTNKNDISIMQFLGFDPEDSMLATTYDKLNEAKIKAESTLPESLKWPYAYLASQAEGYYRNGTQVFQDIAYAVWAWENKMKPDEQFRIAQAVRNIRPGISLNAYLGTQWIIDPQVQAAIQSELPTIIESLRKKNITGSQVIREQWVTPSQINIDDFGSMMKNLRTDNPKMFNTIIQGIADIVDTNIKRQEEWGKALWGERGDIDTVKKKLIGLSSNVYTDAIVSAVLGDDANSSAVSEWFGRIYSDFYKGSYSQAERQNAIAQANNILKVIYDNNPYSDWLDRAIAMKTIETLNKIEEEKDTQWLEAMWEMIDRAPYLKKAIRNGMTYQWWFPLNGEKTTATNRQWQNAPEIPQTSEARSELTWTGSLLPWYVPPKESAFNIEWTPATTPNTNTPEPVWQTTTTPATSSYRSWVGTTSSTTPTTTDTTGTTSELEWYQLAKAAKTEWPEKVTLTELLKRQQSSQTTPQKTPKKTLSDLRLKSRLWK
jgi:hypothetical protein